LKKPGGAASADREGGAESRGEWVERREERKGEEGGGLRGVL
jgi:hypothetical protein